LVCAGAWRNSYAHADTDGNCDPNCYRDSDSNSNTNSYSHADACTDSHIYPDPDTSESDPNAHTHTNSDAHANTHTRTGIARELVICRSISAWTQTGVGCRF
jgi:hypothetical protein